jgi:hypothetical protein
MAIVGTESLVLLGIAIVPILGGFGPSVLLLLHLF